MRRYTYKPRKPITKRGKTIICVFFIVFGLIFFGVGATFLGSLFRDRSVCSFETEGVVVELVQKVTTNKGHKRLSYAPVFSYEFEGVSYKYKSSVYSQLDRFKIGQRVTVMVNPDEPTEVYIPESNIEWILGWIIAGVGGLLISVFVFLLIKTRREGRTPLTIEDELSQYQREEQYYSDPDGYFK